MITYQLLTSYYQVLIFFFPYEFSFEGKFVGLDLVSCRPLTSGPHSRKPTLEALFPCCPTALLAPDISYTCTCEYRACSYYKIFALCRHISDLYHNCFF